MGWHWWACKAGGCPWPTSVIGVDGLEMDIQMASGVMWHQLFFEEHESGDEPITNNGSVLVLCLQGGATEQILLCAHHIVGLRSDHIVFLWTISGLSL